MTQLIRIAFLLIVAAPVMAQRPIDFGPMEWPQAGNLVIPVAEGESFTGPAAELDDRTDGAIALAAAEAAFKGEAGQTLTLFGIRPYARIDLIGVGSGPIDTSAVSCGPMRTDSLCSLRGAALATGAATGAICKRAWTLKWRAAMNTVTGSIRPAPNADDQ